MGFYDNVVVPKLCDLAMRNRHLVPYRRRVIGAAEGRVLEIGAGSGLNFRFYAPGVREVLALEPNPRLLRMAEDNAGRAARPITFIKASAEEIPLDDSSVDTVVTTWALCTIPDGIRALRDARRILKPGGRLLFVEHGIAPDANVRTWQNRLNPVWTRISGGCHMNRPIVEMIGQAGFQIETLDTGYAPGPKVMTFLSEGSAVTA